MNAAAPITVACPVDIVNGFDALDALDKFLDPWNAPGWHKAAIEYREKRGRNVSEVSLAPEEAARLRRLTDDDVSHERAWFELGRGRPTPEVTIRAIVFAIRARGVAALKEPATRGRLSCCDAWATAEINRRVKKNGSEQ